MDIFLYIMIFIMGTVFGSFFTLAVYRIPLKKDITHERSFCPTCNHRLEFLDLIPVFSYIFLRGKCRYCGEKVRIRYLVLEVLSGIVFVITYLSLNIQNIFFDSDKIVYFISFVFMYVTLALIGGIDKEHRKIEISVLLFGVICHTIYIIYLCIVSKISIYKYAIYLTIFTLLFITYLIFYKKKNSYIFQIILFISYIAMTVAIRNTIMIVLLSFVVGILYKIILKKNFKKIRYGFIISIFTVVYKIVENFITFY